jgi:nucleoid-associated protein YgaU
VTGGAALDQVVAAWAGRAAVAVAAYLAAGVLAGAASALPGVAGRLGARIASVTPALAVSAGRRAAGLAVVAVTAVAGAGALPGVAAAATLTTTDHGGGRPVAGSAGAGAAADWPTEPRLRHHGHAAHPAAGPGDVVVRPGDCLWSIAARELPGRATPGRVARAWPRWWSANRTVIGPDPARLLPGEVLHQPLDR